MRQGFNHPMYDEPPSEELNQFILTIVATELLKNNFMHKKAQWKMIVQNAELFC